MAKITTFASSDGKSYLCLTAKRVYAIVPGRRAEPTTEPAPLVEEPEYEASTTSGEDRLVSDTDFFPGLKPVTDVLLRGTAHSHKGALPSFRASLSVGLASKVVQIWGDRTLRLEKGGALSFSAPAPLSALPLLWDFAYGGRDAYTEARPPAGGEEVLGMRSYPRNPAGRGFFVDVDRERIAGTLAPNLEDPTDPVTPDRLCAPTYDAWIDCPAAACFEPIDALTFPRTVFFVPALFDPPRRELYEAKVGVVDLAEIQRKMDGFDGTVDPRAFNAAPAGLARARLTGGERAQLVNLHAKHEVLDVELPGDPPRLLLEPPGVRAREIAPVLQTVLFEPDRDRVTLTWAGTLEVAMPYPEEMIASMRHAVTWAR